MSVTFPSPPGDSFTALQQGLRAIKGAQLRGKGPLGQMAIAANPSAMKPHPIYEIGLDDLAAGKEIASARPVAWRYLLIAGNQVHQAAEIIPDPLSGGSRFGALTTGYVAGEEEALKLADKLPEISQGAYEIRSLRVPALYVMALWLKDLHGDKDRFIVMPPAFPPVQALQPYSTSDLFALLHKAAAKKAPLEKRVAPP